jgi:hypothetical protein
MEPFHPFAKIRRVWEWNEHARSLWKELRTAELIDEGIFAPVPSTFHRARD